MFPTIDRTATGLNLRKIMDLRGMTVRDVQEYLGLASVQSIYHWLNGISMPTIDNLYALSELFGISIDDMVCGNRRRRYRRPKFRDSRSNRLLAYYTMARERMAA